MSDNQKEIREIDLFYIGALVYRKIGGAMNCFKEFIARLIRLAWRKKKLVVLGLALGIAYGIYWTERENFYKKYQSESLLVLYTSSSVEVAEVLNALDVLCKTKAYDEVAEGMNVSVDDAKSIREVHAYYWVDERHDGVPTRVDINQDYLKDTSLIRIGDRLQIEVVTSNKEIIPKLDKCLTSYISRNPRIAFLHQQSLDRSEKMIGFYANETVMLDSLRRVDYFHSSQAKMKIDGPMIISKEDKRLYHEEILDLRSKHQDLIQKIEIGKIGINFAHTFVLKKYSIQITKTLLKFGLIGLMSMLAILYIIDRKKAIMEFLEKEDK